MNILKSTQVTPVTLIDQVRQLKEQGFRFVTMTCMEKDETTLELIYHFDRDLLLTHLRLESLKTAPLPSISPVYFAAFLVENEIIDQFGTKFDGLVLDFGGTLYLDDTDDIQATPFCRYGVKQQTPEN